MKKVHFVWWTGKWYVNLKLKNRQKWRPPQRSLKQMVFCVSVLMTQKHNLINLSIIKFIRNLINLSIIKFTHNLINLSFISTIFYAKNRWKQARKWAFFNCYTICLLSKNNFLSFTTANSLHYLLQVNSVGFFNCFTL